MVTCPQCSLEFASAHDAQRFCSRACSNRSRSKLRVARTCPTCGESWMPKRTTTAQEYCSLYCARWSQKRSGGRAPGYKRADTTARTCIHCSMAYQGFGNSRYCSAECRRLYRPQREQARVRLTSKTKAALQWTETRKRLHAEQGGTCAICKTAVPRPHLDHDHSTGQIRGVLCAKCNTGLGLFADDPARLRAAAEYLEKGSTLWLSAAL